MAVADRLPLDKRIDLGEAVIELVWAELKALDPFAWGDTRRRREALRGQLDALLEEILPLYDLRALGEAS